MDNSLFRTINRFADRTGWAHGAFKANAGYGIVLFAVLLVIAYLDGRHHADLTAVAGSVWAARRTGRPRHRADHRWRRHPRPTLRNDAKRPLLVDKTTDFSFPSDHATVAGAVAVDCSSPSDAGESSPPSSPC